MLDEVDNLQTEHGRLLMELQGYAKEKAALQAWGNFEPENVRRLEQAGYAPFLQLLGKGL